MDAVEALRAFMPGCEDAKLRNFGMTIGIRDTRKIEALYDLTEQDVREQARFDDSIGIFPEFIDGYGILILPTTGRYFQVPYRSLVPKGVGHLIVAGRCIGGDKVSHASVRSMMCCTVSGQGAGVAAAVSLRTDDPFETLDVRADPGGARPPGRPDPLSRRRADGARRRPRRRRATSPTGTDGLSSRTAPHRTVGHAARSGPCPTLARCGSDPVVEVVPHPMVLADERRATPRPARPAPARPTSTPGGPRGAAPTRADALRRIAAEVSGRQDLARALRRRHRRGRSPCSASTRPGLWLTTRRRRRP